MNDSDPEKGRPALADDLSFLADLDRGLDAPARPDLQWDDLDDPPSWTPDPAPPPSSPDKARRRPLLDLFPPPTASSGPLVPVPTRAEGLPTSPGSLRRAHGIVAFEETADEGSLTYETFYGLREKPFGPTSELRFLYRSSSHDRATQDILSAIGRRDQIVTVTGGIGTGKTTLCRTIIEQIDRRTFTSFVSDPFVSIEDLLKTILGDFGVISRVDLAGGRLADASRYELTTSLREFLLSLAQLDAFAVVFVDDAHNLTPDTLEFVSSISDLQDQQRLIQIVLVGEPALFRLLDRPDLRPLRERIATRCTLEPMSREEVQDYIDRRLSVAGDGQSRVSFEEPALTSVYELSRGVPRLVNRLCDRALAFGFDASASEIDRQMVERAAVDLEISRERPSMKFVRAGLLAAALVALVLVGAGAAAFIFQDRLEQVVAAWQAAPPPPPEPRLRLAAPAVPVPVEPETGTTTPRQ